MNFRTRRAAQRAWDAMSPLDQFAQIAAERGYWWSVWPNGRLGIVRLMASPRKSHPNPGPEFGPWVATDLQDAAAMAVESMTEGPRLPKMDG